MKQVLCFIVNFAMIFIGSLVAPEYIYVKDWKTAILVAVVMIISQVVISLVGIVVAAISVSIGNNTWNRAVMVIAIIMLVIVLIAMTVGSSLASIVIADKLIDGFAINGAGAYAVLTILTTIFASTTTIRVKSNDYNC